MAGRKSPEELEAEKLLGLDDGQDSGSAELEAALQDEPEERLHPLLSNEEVLAAREEARQKVLEKRRAAARSALVKEETERLAREEGLTTHDATRDEIVSITLDLAEHSSCITLNGMAYWHGQTYRVPRHVADTLREIQSRGHDHQTDLDGKGLAERLRKPRNTVVSGKTGGVANAPQAVH